MVFLSKFYRYRDVGSSAATIHWSCIFENCSTDHETFNYLGWRASIAQRMQISMQNSRKLTRSLEFNPEYFRDCSWKKWTIERLIENLN